VVQGSQLKDKASQLRRYWWHAVNGCVGHCISDRGLYRNPQPPKVLSLRILDVDVLFHREPESGMRCKYLWKCNRFAIIDEQIVQCLMTPWGTVKSKQDPNNNWKKRPPVSAPFSTPRKWFLGLRLPAGE